MYGYRMTTDNMTQVSYELSENGQSVRNLDAHEIMTIFDYALLRFKHDPNVVNVNIIDFDPDSGRKVKLEAVYAKGLQHMISHLGILRLHGMGSENLEDVFKALTLYVI